MPDQTPLTDTEPLGEHELAWMRERVAAWQNGEEPRPNHAEIFGARLLDELDRRKAAFHEVLRGHRAEVDRLRAENAELSAARSELSDAMTVAYEAMNTLSEKGGEAIRERDALAAKVERLQSERNALVAKFGLDWGPDEFGDLDAAPESPCPPAEAADSTADDFDDWLLAPHHDTGGEYGLYHDCNPHEAVIGISEQSLSSVLEDVREHECEESDRGH